MPISNYNVNKQQIKFHKRIVSGYSNRKIKAYSNKFSGVGNLEFDSLSSKKSTKLMLQIEGRNFSILTWNLTSLNTIDAVCFS